MVIAALLVVNAVITALCFVALWLISLRLKDVSFIDAWWALGLVVIAWVSFMNSKPGSPHALLLTTLCTIWGPYASAAISYGAGARTAPTAAT